MAGDVHISGFHEGMDQDISKTKMSPNAYYSAKNFRVTTDKGLSNFSLENIRGNIKLIEFPLLDSVVEVTFSSTIFGSISLEIYSNDFNDIPVYPFITSSATTPLDYYNHLMADPGMVNRDVKYKITYNESHILIHSLEYLGLLGAAEFTTFGAVDIDLAYTLPVTTPVEPIGSTYINDDFYILTTACTDIAPGESPTPQSLGQIWKLVLDKTISPFTASLELIYNNKLDFSTYNPIAPSAIEGRYEIDVIQRIYWTDNYNKLRQLNVANPQAFATDPSLLDVVPSVDFDIPILTTIGNTGSANSEVGAYQIAYRLSNVGGAVTSFSNLSNMIYVVPGDEAQNTSAQSSATFAAYVGAGIGTTVAKAITWKIENIDPNYQRIEIALYFKKSIEDAGVFSIIYNENLSGDTYSVLYDGSQPKTTLTINDFLLNSNSFTHCKTIATKNNRLIAGNIRSKKTELSIEDYDARAYRFRLDGTAYVINDGNIEPINTALPLWDVLETSDAINTDIANYKYIQGVGNRPLGGSGPNISYEFYTVDVEAESAGLGTNFNVIFDRPAPWRYTRQRYFGVSDQNLNVFSPTNTIGTQALQNYPLPVPNLRDGFKYPQVTSMWKGYQRTETYRFGIQFFDKSKNPMFVKWIGDIKFPDFNDINANHYYEDGSTAPHGDFRATHSVADKNGLQIAFVRTLGIKFTVNNLDTIADRISGYSIVRVKREDTDKTIVAQGYGTLVDFANAAEGQKWYSPSLKVNSELNGLTNSGPDAGSRIFFITPDIMNLPIELAPGMSIVSKFTVVPANSDGDMTFACDSGRPYYVYKYYNHGGFGGSNVSINQVFPLSYGQTGTDSTTGFPVGNYDYGHGGAPATESHSIGNHAYFIKGNGGILAGTGKVVHNIVRSLPSQYGGNTYSARGNSEYIACNHFRPVRTGYNITSDTFQVFGGDVYMNMYDSLRLTKNFVNDARPPVGGEAEAVVFYIPIESTVNTDLRHGTYWNKSVTTSCTSFQQMHESYEYNRVYSAESDIVKYFPKPDPYIENNVWVNRFMASNIKTNGELADSWAVFNEQWDVDGSNGPITAMGSLADEIYFVQHSALGKLLVSPKASVGASTGNELRIGTGEVLDSHQYYSVETGCKHQFSFLKTPSEIMFFDIRSKKMINFGPGRAIEPLTDVKGMSSFVRAFIKGDLEVVDKPTYLDPVKGISGIYGVYDYVNSEMIYTISRSYANNNGADQGVVTLVYNQKIGKYTAFYDHTPKLYITNNQDFFSHDLDAFGETCRLWLHNYGRYGEFYGSTYGSDITFFANKNPAFTKVFTNYEFQTEMQNGDTLVDIASGATPIQDSFDFVVSSTDYQTGQTFFTPGTTMKRKLRTWRAEVPRNATAAAYVSTGILARMRDKYLKSYFSFINNNNRRFIVHSIMTYFSLNKPH